MSNWIPKNKIVGFALSMLFMSLILYSTGLFIVIKKIKEIEKFYQSTESELNKEERRLALKSIVQANTQEVQSLRDLFIQKGDEVKFIEKIEEVAKKYDVQFEINSIDIKAKEESSFKEDVIVKMNISGAWVSIISFLDKLDKMSFGVSIQSLNLDANMPSKWAGSVTFIVFREK